MPDCDDVDLSSLDLFRPDYTQTQVADLDSLIPPTVVIPFEGIVIAFDQSIAHTGYVVVDLNAMSGISVVAMDQIVTVSDGRTGWDDNFARSVTLWRQTCAVLRQYSPMVVIHEMPPVGNGPGIRRPESSIVAAGVIQVAAAAIEVPVRMVSAQKAKHHLTGVKNASKRLVRKSLMERMPQVFSTKQNRINEHTVDALALVVTFFDSDR
jgi:Holliday junction resolvasome RuvABC endonuclease subunit